MSTTNEIHELYRYGLEPSRSYFLGYELWTFGSQLSKEEIDHFDNVLGYNRHTIEFALYRADRELDEYLDKNPPIPMTTEDPFGTKD